LARFSERVGGGKFNVEPFLVAIGVTPDAAHFFASVALNHLAISGLTPCNDTVFLGLGANRAARARSVAQKKAAG
jgi:hypothetical protein